MEPTFALENRRSRRKNRPVPDAYAAGDDKMRKGFRPLALS